MRKRVYIETSAISFLLARPGRDLVVAAHQEITRQWWDHVSAKYDLYVSEAVIREAGVGDPHAAAQRLARLQSFPILDLNPEVEKLARDILAGGAMPPQAAREIQDFLQRGGCAYCFIGGIAAQRRGRPRIAPDVARTLLTPLASPPRWHRASGAAAPAARIHLVSCLV